MDTRGCFIGEPTSEVIKMRAAQSTDLTFQYLYTKIKFMYRTWCRLRSKYTHQGNRRPLMRTSRKWNNYPAGKIYVRASCERVRSRGQLLYNFYNSHDTRPRNRRRMNYLGPSLGWQWYVRSPKTIPGDKVRARQELDLNTVQLVWLAFSNWS